MERDKIKERWSEYIQELYDGSRDENLTMEYQQRRDQKLMKEEVRYALKKMKSGKVTEPDGISVEMITALGNVGMRNYH